MREVGDSAGQIESRATRMARPSQYWGIEDGAHDLCANCNAPIAFLTHFGWVHAASGMVTCSS